MSIRDGLRINGDYVLHARRSYQQVRCSRESIRPHAIGKPRLRGVSNPRRRVLQLCGGELIRERAEECPIRFEFCLPSILKQPLKGIRE
jgi:hypothetical protein